VVDAVRLPAGGCEFLAVTALATAEPRAADDAPAQSAPRLRATQLPLPYALPE
jgi:hypothetical protein